MSKKSSSWTGVGKRQQRMMDRRPEVNVVDTKTNFLLEVGALVSKKNWRRGRKVQKIALKRRRSFDDDRRTQRRTVRGATRARVDLKKHIKEWLAIVSSVEVILEAKICQTMMCGGASEETRLRGKSLTRGRVL